VDMLYIMANFVDPPAARLDLQVRNASSASLLLGYDPGTTSMTYFCNVGFFFGDSYSQCAFMNKSSLPLNLTVKNTPTNLSVPPVYLNQSTTIGLTNSTDMITMFGYVKSGNQVSSILSCNSGQELACNRIQVESLSCSDQSVVLKIHDEVNQVVKDPVITVIDNGTPLVCSIADIGNGTYKISLDPRYKGYEVSINVEKSGYLMGSLVLILDTYSSVENQDFAIGLIWIIIIIASGIVAFQLIRYDHQNRVRKARRQSNRYPMNVQLPWASPRSIRPPWLNAFIKDIANKLGINLDGVTIAHSDRLFNNSGYPILSRVLLESKTLFYNSILNEEKYHNLLKDAIIRAMWMHKHRGKTEGFKKELELLGKPFEASSMRELDEWKQEILRERNQLSN